MSATWMMASPRAVGGERDRAAGWGVPYRDGHRIAEGLAQPLQVCVDRRITGDVGEDRDARGRRPDPVGGGDLLDDIAQEQRLGTRSRGGAASTAAPSGT
ncbi:hypothetical protein ACFXKS_38560 [Streptomyces scopuliridis]|uniref:hypothetical protein n=1 Tax=Streptomyces scopuliridis TaxID=452529 RepID=UPI00369B2CA5